MLEVHVGDTTFSMTTLSIIGLFATISINDNRHKTLCEHYDTQYLVKLCWVPQLLKCYAERHYAECHYAESHYAECHYAECHGAAPRAKGSLKGATPLIITTFSIMTLSVMTLSIMTLNIMAFSITINKTRHSA
jgi:hypothetical protein